MLFVAMFFCLCLTSGALGAGMITGVVIINAATAIAASYPTGLYGF
jgi:hypothetical protein